MNRLTTAPLSLDYAIATAVFSGISSLSFFLACFGSAAPILKDYFAAAAAVSGVVLGVALAVGMAIGHSHIRKVLNAKS
jgi:hypothetical protein